jgi:hypothetical protein
MINWPFLHDLKGTPDEYKAGLMDAREWDICEVHPGRRRAVRVRRLSSMRCYFEGGRNSPFRSFATTGDLSGSSPSQCGH